MPANSYRFGLLSFALQSALPSPTPDAKVPKRPLVTVVTPTFNREALLGETIESILNQDFGEFEYIVIDDGSTDETAKLVTKFGDRIKYVYQENQGERAAVNAGWAMASGDYFAMVSSDDLMRPKWLSTCIDFMEANPQILVAYPDWTIIDKLSQPVQDVTTFDYSMKNMISWFHAFPGPGAIIRRSAVQQFVPLREQNLVYCSDMLMWFRLALHGEFARVPQLLATWRQHGESITVKGCTLDRANELVRMAGKFFLTPGLSNEVLELKPHSLGRAYAVAAVLTKDSHPYWSFYFSQRMEALKCWDEENLPLGIRMGKFVDLKGLLQRNIFVRSDCPHFHKI